MRCVARTVTLREEDSSQPVCSQRVWSSCHSAQRIAFSAATQQETRYSMRLLRGSPAAASTAPSAAHAHALPRCTLQHLCLSWFCRAHARRATWNGQMAPVTDVMLTSSNMAGDFRKINLGAGGQQLYARRIAVRWFRLSTFLPKWHYEKHPVCLYRKFPHKGSRDLGLAQHGWPVAC